MYLAKSRRSQLPLLGGFFVLTPVDDIVNAIAKAGNEPEALLGVIELQVPVLSLLRVEIESEIECCAQIADQMGRADIGNRIRVMRMANLNTLRTVH